MLKEERQNIILHEIKTHNKVLSSTLSELLEVSEDTIRRDLKELSESGYVKKVHGGAMANPNLPKAIEGSNISQQKERKIIAEKAAELLQSNQVILMEGESTNLILIDLIPKEMALTIFTNSLQIASKLFELKNVETIFLGGRISHKHKMALGMDVINALKEIHADLCFIETNSIHEEIGITDSDRENAFTKKAMFQSSSQVVALCLSEDIGTIQPFKVEGINQLHTIITDIHPNDQQLDRFNNKGVLLA